ncbi:MAG: TldD/PmbA family protein [Saccharospirillum sp.]
MTRPTYIDDLLQQVIDAGATADVLIDEQTSLSLKARDGTLEEQAVSDTRIIGLRLIKDNKVGLAFSEAADTEALRHLVAQALLNARFAKADAHQSIQGNATQWHSDDALLCPPSDLADADRIELALELEQACLAQPYIKSLPYNGMNERIHTRQLFNTSGLGVLTRQRVNALYAYALAEQDETTAMAFKGQVARTGGQLKLAPVVEQACSQAARMLTGSPVSSGHYSVIFERDAQQSLFNAFSLCLSGKSAMEGVNPWRDKVGQCVASPLLTLTDQPLLQDGFGYQPFDAEGTACEPTRIVTEGCLDSLLHNSVTAHRLGTANTGHAQRSPKSALGVGAHQLHIAPGSADHGELTAGEYLELTDLQGTHSGANALSGEFSFGASGYLCRNGERVRPVRGITVAGNFYDLLKRIEAVGKEALWDWQRGSLMPSLRFGDVVISG